MTISSKQTTCTNKTLTHTIIFPQNISVKTPERYSSQKLNLHPCALALKTISTYSEVLRSISQSRLYGNIRCQLPNETINRYKKVNQRHLRGSQRLGSGSLFIKYFTNYLRRFKMILTDEINLVLIKK